MPDPTGQSGPDLHPQLTRFDPLPSSFHVKVNVTRRFLFPLVLIVAAASGRLSAMPAQAVTNGELDGDRHPAVGLMLFELDGQVHHRCSGTLITPWIIVTAAHRTDQMTGGRVWFEADVESGIPENGYPFGGPTSIEFAEIHTHPDFDPDLFWMADVAIMILSKPVYLDSYPVLPEPHLLDVFKSRRGLQEAWFTSVGYGYQHTSPPSVDRDQRDRVRMVAYPELVSLASPSDQFAGAALISSKPVDGGICFGDSGGPNFLRDTNIIAGVTSHTMGTNCGGAAGFYRLDSIDALSFIYSFLE